MNNPRDEFIKDELFSLVIRAALGRSKTYAENPTRKQRKIFRDGLREALDAMLNEYKVPVSDGRHIENIKRLSDDISARYPNYLHNGRFRIGSAQKALNLYLKYLWCMDKVACPPHCPFDAIIINKLRPKKRINWTDMDSVVDYQLLVEMARKAANGGSIAEWELEIYNLNSK
jgi:hypothetical protein